MSQPPHRFRDRAPDADELRAGPVADDESVTAEPPATGAVDVACWTPVGSSTATPGAEGEPRATLLAEPTLPSGTNEPVTHTLVLEVDGPMESVELDYRPLDATVVADRGVNVRTDEDCAIAVDEARVADDDTFLVTFADPPTDGALFLEYSVTRNPDSGQHAVSVVVDGERRTEARLVVIG